MKKLLAGLFVVGALVLGGASGTVGAERELDGMPHFGSAPALHTLSSSGSFTCGSITCDAYQTGINTYFQDVAADSGTNDNVYSVATEFYDGTGNIAYNETFGGTYLETKAFPASGCPTGAWSACLTDTQLAAEINSVRATKGWAANGTNLFFIFLPSGVNNCFDGTGNECASNAFCAYHYSSGSLIYAVEPFSAAFSCNGHSIGQGFPNGAEIDQTLNTVSHEQNEAITDPVNAWWNTASGYENGDLCAWSFGDALGTTPGGEPYNQVINGHFYSLQPEWSNAASNNAGGCQLKKNGTVYPKTGGSGPLNYHGGAVMRTHTVYSIFWVPSDAQVPVPALSVSPVVTGTAAVNQQLSTTNGTWTNSPTSYSYKWQRCDGAGLNCTNILNATSAQYTLVPADAGHTIRSGVLASNAGGSASGGYAMSAVTGVVLGKPAATTLPKLTGIAKVGNTLSVSDGVWKYSPALTYQWFRCDSYGMSCKKILTATSSTYKLVSGDANHKLQAKVTGTNIAGSTTAASNKSAVVKR